MAELVEDVAAIGVAEAAEKGIEAIANLASGVGVAQPAQAAPAVGETGGVKIKGKKVVKVPKAAKAEEAAPAAADAPRPRPTSEGDLSTEELKERKKFARAKLPKTITAFWRIRDKYPQYFILNATGDAATSLTFDKKGAPLKKIDGPPDKLFDLPLYTKISREDIDALWAERMSSFDGIYESIETAKTQLRNAHAAFKAGTGTAREVVIANQLVSDEEAKLVAIRSAKRWVEMLENPVTSFIDLQQRYESRKLGFDVNQLKQFALDPQALLRIMTPEEAAGFKGASGGGMLTYGVITDETLLGLHWPADVKVGNTQYFTAFQAILGEASRQNQDLFQSILGTRSSRTLRTLTKELDSSAFTPEILQSVITAMSKQYPEFRELLLETGDDELVYANVLDTIFSVGLEETDPNIQDAKQWRGENLWGKALEEARTEFRESNVTKKPEEEGLTKDDLAPVANAVISKEQQDAAKKAAIINARRFQKHH